MIPVFRTAVHPEWWMDFCIKYARPEQMVLRLFSLFKWNVLFSGEHLIRSASSWVSPAKTPFSLLVVIWMHSYRKWLALRRKVASLEPLTFDGEISRTSPVFSIKPEDPARICTATPSTWCDLCLLLQSNYASPESVEFRSRLPQRFAATLPSFYVYECGCLIETVGSSANAGNETVPLTFV